jgi:hypothetical protein
MGGIGEVRFTNANEDYIQTSAELLARWLVGDDGNPKQRAFITI